MTRYLSSVPIGIAVTFGLLFAMQALIEAGEDVWVDDPTPPIGIDFVRLKRDERVQKDDYEVRPIDPPVDLPQTPDFRPSDEPGSVRLVIDRAPEPGPTADGIDFGTYSDGPLVNIVRVAPTYPAHLLGVEGYVVVQFDVTPSGLVTNVRVLESSHRGFEKSAIRAAQKFRYKPRVVDGVAVSTTNVGYRFRFELEE